MHMSEKSYATSTEEIGNILRIKGIKLLVWKRKKRFIKYFLWIFLYIAHWSTFDFLFLVHESRCAHHAALGALSII